MVENKDTHDDDIIATEDEILPDDIEISADIEESEKNKINALRKKLTHCEEEKRNYLEDLQRARADFLNSKRRLEEQLARDKERATDKILTELLTLVDSFDTAMADTNLWESVDERWRTGVEAIHTKLLSTLKNNNVTPIDPLGDSFNPEEHEAVSNAPVTDGKQVDTVIVVLQKGFKRNGTIIRPAKVIVGVE